MSSNSSNPSSKIILALDEMNKAEVISLIKKLPELEWVKVGLELFLSAGPDIVLELRDCQKKVFLDLKFHDIPNTMARSCYEAARRGAELITVHACAGSAGLKMASKGAKEGAAEQKLKTPSLLAVTVLTSWENETLSKELLFKDSISERVHLLADLAFHSGIEGCVCSPLEVRSLREIYAHPFELVTPGIRLVGDNKFDQKRVLSPLKAIKEGSSRLVIGRSITKANDPLEAFKRIYNELLDS